MFLIFTTENVDRGLMSRGRARPFGAGFSLQLFNIGVVMYANFYIDGFNLYHGIKDTKRKDLLWLNLYTLMVSLKQTEFKVSKIKYFTSKPVHKSKDIQERHATWMKTIRSFGSNIKVIWGRYHKNRPTEKMTDVNMAIQMLNDAYDSNDPATLYYLVSADSDLLPAIIALRKTPTNPRVVVVFPPKRFSKDLRNNANKMKRITIDRLEKNILNNPHITHTGKEVYKPSNWNDDTSTPQVCLRM